MNNNFEWELGQKLVSCQGKDAVVFQRVQDCDTGFYEYRIQFAPYDSPPQRYTPSVAYTCFYKR